MIDTFGVRLLRLAWSLPFAGMLPPRRSVVLLYHSVPAASHANSCRRVLERHVLFLKQHFEFVSPRCERAPEATGKRHVLLTFDDGFRNHAEVVAPILRRYEVPAIFFVSSGHAAPGRYLWFTYLEALERHFPGNGFSYGGKFFNMAGAVRQKSIRRLWTMLLALRPHPTAMCKAIEEELPRLEDFIPANELADRYAGMTAEQVGELAADPLFSIGAHTLDHPFLTLCDRDEALRQVRENRSWIEALSGQKCEAIAYPSGDYTNELVSMCRKEGFTSGYAISSRIDPTSHFEMARVGIYSESTDVLGFKVQWGGLLRAARIPIG